MHVFKNASLKPFNTFGVSAMARYLALAESLDEVHLLLADSTYYGMPLLILGGGSNVLFSKDFEGLVMIICLQGREVTHLNDNEVLVTAASGEVWEDFVDWCVDNGWGGLENLSLIPGKVGACPIQNIGAYGVEVCEVISHIHALDIQNQEVRVFSNTECRFGYRDSIFKNEMRNRYLILSVSFILQKKPLIHIGYPALRLEVLKHGNHPDIKQVAAAVKVIRRSKLPDPAVSGNAGSFFKNPLISKQLFDNLILHHPTLVWYPAPDEKYKLSAAWMIDACGLKGYRHGHAGVHQNQPLVIVNLGGASGNEILELSTLVSDKVFERFGVLLEPEINIL